MGVVLGVDIEEVWQPMLQDCCWGSWSRRWRSWGGCKIIRLAVNILQLSQLVGKLGPRCLAREVVREYYPVGMIAVQVVDKSCCITFFALAEYKPKN